MSLQKKIQKIIDVINNSSIEEIEVSSFWGAQKIRLSKSKTKRQNPVIIKESPPNNDISVSDNKADLSEEKTTLDSNLQDKEENLDSLDIPVISESDNTEQILDENLEYQKAPLVGTFYLSSKPGEPPFVSIGDKVSKGQTLCIIEAMKIFNEIESDFDGEVVEVLVDDESPVEFNQEIFSIKPN